MLGLLQKEAKRFGVSARSDEVLQSSGDHRQKRRSNGMEGTAKESAKETAPHNSYGTGPGSVMPKGRNFH